MIRKSTATMTFHAAHNYGSVLQAYALQQVIKKMGHTNQIINLRTERQKECYKVFTKRKGLKYVFKNAVRGLYCQSLQKRYDKFEDFINNYLDITQEYTSEDALRNADLQYDCYIAGSDQIWNPIPADFDWSYYLSFVKTGRKIAYAPSFGPLASLGDADTQQYIAEYLNGFDVISVREKGSADNVKQMTGTRPQIVLDPTLLLDKEEYFKLIEDQKPIFEGEYLFFYTLFADKERMDIVKQISNELGLPVITSNFSNQYDIITPFKKKYDAGPLDFLNLVRHAKLSVCSSFHGTVFLCHFQYTFLGD